MLKLFARNIFRFLFLLLLQVFLFNRIELSGYLNPYVYVLFILLLPFETPRWSGLILAFMMGLGIDLFTGTIGIHATATVFMAYLRPFVLEMISPRDGYEIGSFPRIHYYGFSWFLKYSLILVFAHHFVLFYLEVFKFEDFFSTLLRVLLSVIFSVTLIILSQYVIFRR